jgi:Flp pilus assembly protein TadD
VNGIAGDSKHTYFATEAGLVSLDLATGAWAAFHKQDGLSGEECLSVAVDNTGQVWVSTTSPSPLMTSPVLRYVLIGALALSVLLPLGVVAWFLWRRRKKARRLLETKKWAEEFSGPTPDRGESVWAQIADFVFRPELLVLLLIALFLYVLPPLVPVYGDWLRQIGQRLEGFREILFFGAMILTFAWQGGLVALASRRLKRGDYDGALKPIQAGLKIQPRATELLTALMVIYLQQGRLEEAEQVARKRLKLARNDPVSYGNLGCVLAEAGQHTEAQLACQRAIELSAKLSSAYNNLAWSLVLRGEQLERAIGLLNISLKLSRSNELRSACTGTLSLALFKLGRVAEALEKRQEALRLADKSDRPRLAEMHYWLGLIQREAGTTGEALSSFKQVFTLDPHGRYVQKAQQALWEMGVRG